MTSLAAAGAAYPFYAAFAHGPAFTADVTPLAARYRSAVGFPHVVVDGMFRPDVLAEVVRELPSPLDRREALQKNDVPALQERKYAFRDITAMGPASRYLIETLNAKPFLEFLVGLTGIAALIPDPYLIGAGFHQILRGGLLKIHADFNVHPVMHVYRRLNLLLYLNDGWDTDWGGDLELWHKDMSACAERIAPVFNRMVVFNTTETSFHGHPHPLNCPPDVVRRSLALYYYTVERLTEAEHSTLWQGANERRRP